jgi:hypothetical protein
VNVTFKKSKPAEKRYALYTGDKPASWFVLVDGVVRGEIKGGCGQYSRLRTYELFLDGKRVENAYSLAYAKERALVELRVPV